MTYDKPTRIPFPSTFDNEGIPYAGIGSRELYEQIKKGNTELLPIKTMMIQCGYYMALLGYCLRSGGADGPDEYFELGVDLAIYLHGKGQKEIFLPWKGFRSNPSHLNGSGYLPEVMKEMIYVASEYHPAWKKEKTKLFKENPDYKLEEKLIDLKGQSAYKPLMSRNVLQIRGEKLDKPAKFVLCWTKDGVISSAERTFKTGGTGQAIAIASDLGIQVYNLAREDHFVRISKAIKGWEEKFGLMPDINALPYKLEQQPQNSRKMSR